MDEFLPDGKTKLPHDWALEHPQDYLEVLSITIPEVLKLSGVDAKDDWCRYRFYCMHNATC